MFKKKRLEEAPLTLAFHDKMTKQNSKTFSNVDANKAIGIGTGPEGGDKCIWPHDPCCSEWKAAHEGCPGSPSRSSTMSTNKCLWVFAEDEQGCTRRLDRNVSPVEDIPDPSSLME